MPSDVNITVMIDGKPAFCHGANGSTDPLGCIAFGLSAATAHFGGLRIAATPPANLSGSGQQTAAESTKGPSL